MKPSIKFNEFGSLVCPNCGGEYTHHESVTLFMRPGGEDSESEAMTIDAYTGEVSRGTINGSRNPSFRRHALTVSLSCEGCDHEIELTLAQQKGQTFVSVESSRVQARLLGR